MSDYESAKASEELAEQVRPILAGQPPNITGAALANLTATWLAGHVIAKEREMTNKMRESLLRMHVEMIREFLPTAAAEIEARCPELHEPSH